MADTKIEWADAVWNPVTGCTKISEGCQNCYAERMAKRLAGRHGYPADEPFRVTIHGDKINEPLRIGKPKRIFLCSMSDLFHEDVPENIIYNIFAVMADTPRHTYMVLTKRPARMAEILCRPNAAREVWGRTTYSDYPGCKKPWPLHNVWLGVTAENQQTVDERIPILLQIPAAVRFVSCEPMLGPVNLKLNESVIYHTTGWHPPLAEYTRIGDCIHWIIAGGETGPNARPLHPGWVRSLRDQCQAAGVPFFFKQWGEWKEADFSEPIRTQRVFVNAAGQCLNHLLHDALSYVHMVRVGKKKAGRLLDGRTWDEMPGVS